MGIRIFLKLARGQDVFFYSLIWLVCGTSVILRGTVTHVVGIEWVDVDLIPILLVYLMGKDRTLGAGWLAFFMGLLTDMLTPSQLGLFAFAYSAILLGINYCRTFLDFTKIKTSILLVAIFVLAKWSLLLSVIRIFPLGHSVPSITFISLSISAVTMSIIAPFLFYLLNLATGGENRSYA